MNKLIGVVRSSAQTRKVLSTAKRLLVPQHPVVLISVADVRDSTPREAGALMMVSATTSVGTIGGGELEHQAIHQAKTMLDARESMTMLAVSTLTALLLTQNAWLAELLHISLPDYLLMLTNFPVATGAVVAMLWEGLNLAFSRV